MCFHIMDFTHHAMDFIVFMSIEKWHINVVFYYLNLIYYWYLHNYTCMTQMKPYKFKCKEI